MQSAAGKNNKLARMILTMAIVAGAIFVAGCTNQTQVTYIVWVDGLDNCTCDGTAEILVPMPLRNDRPIFTSDKIYFIKPGTGREVRDSAWTATALDTKYGRMISIRSKNDTLSNFGMRADASFDKPHSEDSYNQAFNSIMNNPLSPTYNKTDYVYASGSNNPLTYDMTYPPNFTTLIYIGENIKPTPGEIGNLTIYAYLLVSGGTGGCVDPEMSVRIYREVAPEERGMNNAEVRFY